jgi:cellulose synthase operon protein C
MAKPQLEKIKEFFEQGGTIEDLITPAERELLKRASILRSFDEEIFDKFLKMNLSEKRVIKFERFVKNPQIEPVPRTVDTYAVKEAVRSRYLRQLASDKNSNDAVWKNEKEIFEKLIPYYERDRAECDLDRLILLALFNPEQAQNELEILYKKADERFDLARCNDLLRTFEIRLPLLPYLEPFCLSRRQYYKARNLYISDFYQTNTYLERGNMTKDFANLLAQRQVGSAKWVFHVYATGGLGKTMFVRSLISRYCVPEPKRIPVARLDFDLLDLTYASRYPLLLLLPIADQLNEQIEDRPFTEVFSDMREFKPLLETPLGGASNVNRPALEASFRSFESSRREIALKEFFRTLEEVRFDKPIVIAIDTFEEMLFLNREALVTIIGQIQEIHRAFPALRLILSGRYDLRKELQDGLSNFFQNETFHCELKRFAKKEARTYLTELRKLQDVPLIEAIIEKCAESGEGEINPFILSLMADLVSAKEVNSVEDVQKFPHAEVAYMIQRIIDRIGDFDVRWLLRYAVIPRVLTLEVVEEILWPHLKLERQEKRGDDLKWKSGDFDQADYWEYGETATAKKAWDKLTSYVSSFGWIQYENNDKTRLRLHPEVINPMRFLLAKEAIFERLHNDSSLYFAQKAEAKPKEFADWMSEAIYHRFQAEGQKASAFWREQLFSRQLEHDLKTRRRLATEITKRRDYVDEKGAPLRWPKFKEGIVSLKDLCSAHHEAAVDSIMLATQHKPETDHYADEWDQAREHLLKLDALLKSQREVDFKTGFDTESYIKLASRLNKPVIDYQSVIPLMENVLSSTAGLFLSLSLQLQLAELHARINSRKAETYFRQARDAARIGGIHFLSPPSIHYKLAQWYQNDKSFDKALAEFEAALALPELDKYPALRRQIKHGQAEVNREMGRHTSAVRIAQRLYESTPNDAPDRFDHAFLLANLALRELYRPLPVLNRLLEINQLAGDQTKRIAAVNELHGCVLAELMEFKEAPNVLELAKEQWGRVPDPVSADRARMYRFEFQLDQIGNVKDTAFLIEAWEIDNDKQELKDPELSCQMALLRVRSLYMQGEDEKALEKWRSLLRRRDVLISPRDLARVLSTGLALGFDGSETLEHLLAILPDVKPSSARLPLLGAFRFAERSTDSEAALMELIQLIQWPPDKRPSVVSVVMFTDVLRFCDAVGRVEDLLGHEIVKVLERHDLFAYVQLLSALNRSGRYALKNADINIDIYATEFLQEYKSYPNLCYVALLEQAERELENGDLKRCEATLKDAVNNYENRKILNRWRGFAQELSGRLALKRGREKMAAAHFGEASSIYERLGNKCAAQQVDRTGIGRRRRRALAQAIQQRTVHSIRLEALPSGISVTSGVGAQQKIESRQFPTSEVTTQLTASLRDRTEIFNLMARITDDFTGFNQELGKLLLTPEEIGHFRNLRDRERLLDARLELPLAAAKMPWEWAAIGEDPVLTFFRYFYRGSSASAAESEAIKWIHFAASRLESDVPIKIDGFFGPPIQDLFRKMGIQETLSVPQIYDKLSQRLRERRRSGQVRALIIKPSFDAQLSNQRGNFAADLSSYYLYDDLGFACTYIDLFRTEQRREELISAVANFRPQLIHIESSFRQNPTSADVYLVFGAQGISDRVLNEGPYASDYVQLSTTWLNDALASLPDTMLRPLVILEGQRTPSLSSTVHQVLLRNTFASELFRLGNTSGVVATGLFRSAEDRPKLLKPLINQLANLGSLGVAVNEINSRNIIAAADLDLISCPVLLTDNPMFILVPTQ